MTALETTADGTPQPGTHAEGATAAGPLAGDPAILGLPSFIVGSIALGLVLVGLVPATAVGASLPIILAATSAGLFVAAIWSAAIGQSAVASIFGIFAGFWLSYALLVLGLIHSWFGITVAAAVATQTVFALIDVALLLLIIATVQASTGLLKTAGYVVLAFAALGVYLFFGSASVATGGNALPLGRPILR